MEMIKHGTVKQGAIVFREQVPLPDGTDVVARIEPIGETGQAPRIREAAAFAALPVFGMWADREDMTDSIARVRAEQDKWPQRTHARINRSDILIDAIHQEP
jgi:hypothetical protein